MSLDNVSRDDTILGGLTLLLVIDLLLLPWFSVGGGSIGGIPIPSIDLTATDAPDGWLGILAVIAGIALLADLAAERFSPQTQLPMIGGSRASTRLVLAGATAVFVALKFLFHIHFGDFGFGFWLAVVLTAGIVFSVMRLRQGQPIAPAS
jgi:hypothetical protein